MQNKQKKGIWQSILNPTTPAIILFYMVFIISITASIVIIVENIKNIVLNILFFSTAIISILYFIYLTNKYYSAFKYKVKTKLANKKAFHFLTNYNIRSILLSTCTFIINAFYSIFMGVLAIMNKSLWYSSLTLFYIILSTTRARIVLKYSSIKKTQLSHIETESRKTRTFRNCGISIIILASALIFSVVEMVLNPETFMYAEIMIIPVAIFTFYKFSLAIINIFKARKYDDIIVQGARNLNLVAAIMSLLTLQTNIILVFTPSFNGDALNAVMGILCCIIVISLGVVMTINGNKKLKTLNNILLQKKDGN